MSRFVALPTIITDDSALGGSIIERSLYLNGSNTYIQRDSSGGNRRTWTVSFWAKLLDSSATTNQRFWSSGNSGNYDMLKIEYYSGTDSSRQIAIIDQGHAGSGIRFTLKRKFRDSSAWYHFVFASIQHNLLLVKDKNIR